MSSILTSSIYILTLAHGAEYFATTIRGSYEETRQNCIDNGGDLATTIETDEDITALYNLCVSTGSPGNGCYVGFDDLDTLNTWMWVDGTPFDAWDFVDSSGFEVSDWDRCGGVYVPHAALTSLEDFICDWSSGVYGLCETASDDNGDDDNDKKKCIRRCKRSCMALEPEADGEEDWDTEVVPTNDIQKKCMKQCRRRCRAADVFESVAVSDKKPAVLQLDAKGAAVAVDVNGVLVSGTQNGSQQLSMSYVYMIAAVFVIGVALYALWRTMCLDRSAKYQKLQDTSYGTESRPLMA